MKVFTFLIAMVLFLGGFALFAAAFLVEEPWNITFFLGGIVAISVSMAIPFHLLERVD